MTHDPYQMYPTFGAYPGVTNPFTSPFSGMQTSGINPAAYNPQAASAGAFWGAPAIGGQQQGPFGNPGISPQQLQLAAALSGLSPYNNNPYNNVLQNPLIAAALQNQVAAVLQNPVLLAQAAAALGPQAYGQYQQPHTHQAGGIFGQQGFGQQGFPQQQGFGQQGPAFGQFNTPLAPQSWVGQGQAGQFSGGQPPTIHPLLLQMAARAIQTQGSSPWGTY